MGYTFTILTLASVLYVIGGIAMKYSNGFQVLIPSILVFLFFSAAAATQTWGMRATDLGGGYVFVLGLEAILAVLAGVVCFQEPLTGAKILGTMLVVGGITLLKG